MNKLKIIPDQEDATFIILFWGDNPWKKLYKYLFFRRLKPLFSVRSLEELEIAFRDIEEKAAKYFAINVLGKKALLTSELAQKMRDKGISEETLLKTLSLCQKMGALEEDGQILERRIQKEISKGRGLRYAKAKLRRLTDKESIDWNSLEKEEMEKEALRNLIFKKKGKKSEKELFLFLMRRGFRSHLIQEVLKSGH
jgi:SOS response regulatory protein OraA/RecX